jgi:DNA-binding CsgD family transcriptional regulator
MSVIETVQCPILVGRDHLLELADDVLVQAEAGHGRMLLVAGEAGIGKTRLIGAISRRATARGFRWIGGALAPQDSDVPLALFGDLFRDMRSTPALAEPSAGLLAHRQRAIDRGATYSRTLVVDLVERLRTVLDVPTLVQFEDLQWADDLSLEAIAELARVATDLPVLLVATYRRDETPPGTPLRDWRSRLLTQRRAQELRLERLSPDETATMTTLLLATGLPAPREVVEAVHERSDGLPLHIEELIAAARLGGPVDVAAIRGAGVPDTIEDAVLARAARRSPDARAVAQAGAVLGRCFVPSVLAGVMDRPVADLDAALKELVDHGFLYDFGTVDAGYYDFRHQLLREALYRSTPERDRRRYHARAGEFGASLEGASEVDASLHYERAGLRDEAYRAARAGAEEAVRLSAHREAFELYRRAYRNLPDGTRDLERATLLHGYAVEAAAIEDNELAEEVIWAARDAYQAADRPILVAATIDQAHALWRRMGRSVSARRALIARAEVELAALPPGAERDDQLRELRFDRLVIEIDAGNLGAAHAIGAALTAAIEGSDDDELGAAVAERMAMLDILSGNPESGLATMVRVASDATEAHHEEAGVTAYRDAAAFAARVMAYRWAAESLAAGLAYADSIQQSHCAHVMAAVGAEADWAAGRWEAAISTGEQAIADRGCRRAPAMARWAVGYVAFGRGDYDRARSLLEESRRFGDDSEMLEWRLPPAWGLAETAVLDGDPAAAIELCEAALDVVVANGERSLLVMFVVTGVRAYQAAGRPADADRWLARCAAHLAATPAFGRAALDHAAGLVALAGGSTGTARTSLETAIAGWDRHGRSWEGQWARLDLATCLIRSNRFAAAVALASEVRETAARLGSPALLARADELVRQARGRVVADEPWRPLTAREYEVARLIAAGNTNAEIADTLGIAPKTASSHVEHILAKLGASRRAEIAAWATTVDGGPDRGVLAH